MNHSDEELLQLIHGHLDGTLEPDGKARLSQRLIDDPMAADLFVRCANLEGLLDRFHARERTDAEARRLLSALGLAEDAERPAALPIVFGPEDAPLDRYGSSSSPDSAAAPGFPFVRLPNIGVGGGGVWGGAFALVLLIALGAGIFLIRNDEKRGIDGQPAPRVATVAGSIDALWSGESLPDADGWLPRGSVHLRRGQAELHFVSGVVVMLKAPAEFEAVSPTEARLKHGAMTARVDGKKTSFRIHTPTAKVVDLGTEFGLSVADSGETDVAVFDGVVDLSSEPSRNHPKADLLLASAPRKPQRRLTAGEALRVDWQGQFRRIATITDDSFPLLARPQQEDAPRPPLIAAVSDNLRDEDDETKFYRIVTGGFGEDARAYVDRNYEWNGLDESGIPEFLLGADCIMTFNSDKEENLEITVALSRPAAVFVLLDDRDAVPEWLKQSFVHTGLHVGVDEDRGPPTKAPSDHELGVGPGVSIDRKFSIWKREVEQPGPVVFGPRKLGPRLGDRDTGRSMYGIVVIPLDAMPESVQCGPRLAPMQKT